MKLAALTLFVLNIFCCYVAVVNNLLFVAIPNAITAVAMLSIALATRRK